MPLDLLALRLRALRGSKPKNRCSTLFIFLPLAVDVFTEQLIFVAKFPSLLGRGAYFPQRAGRASEIIMILDTFPRMGYQNHTQSYITFSISRSGNFFKNPPPQVLLNIFLNGANTIWYLTLWNLPLRVCACVVAHVHKIQNTNT